MLSLMANYTEPRARIWALMHSSCATRVVFLEGVENIGKSHLLANLRPQIKPAARLSIVDLVKRRGIATPIEILIEISRNIGSDRFPKMRAVLDAARQRPINASVTNVSIEGSYNTVNASALESEDDRLLAAVNVTDAFLADLQAISKELHPLVLAFDAYQGASPLVGKWFDIYLVPGLCSIDHIRLIISAHQVPAEIRARADRTGTGTLDVPLMGVTDAEEWLPIVSSLKLRMPGTPAEHMGYLRGVVSVLKGVPGGIMTHLLTLPVDP